MISTLLTLALGSVPLCTTMPPDVAARLGDQWKPLLEQYSHRQIIDIGECTGDRLIFALEGDAVAVRYTVRTKERNLLLSPNGAAESLALMVAPLVSPEAEVTRAPSLMARVNPPAEKINEHLWAYFDFGVSFTGGGAQSGGLIGTAYRFDAWSFGLEMAQFGTLVGPGPGTPRMWMLNGVIWYGHDFLDSRLRLDGGLGIGGSSMSAPWDQRIPGSFPQTIAVSTRGIGRIRYRFVEWLDVHARAELGLSTKMPGNADAWSYMALMVGAEVNFGQF